MVKLSNTQEELISDFFNLKKDFAFKVEELQAMYLENKNLHKKIEENYRREYVIFLIGFILGVILIWV